MFTLTAQAEAGKLTAESASVDPAEVRPRVVVEVASDARGMLPLLRAELEDLGLEVVERVASDAREVPSEPWPRDPLVTSRILVRTRSVHVWIFDRKANTIALHEVITQADGSPVEARTAVLHAVELLGWSLREKNRRELPAPAPQQPSRIPKLIPAPNRDKEWFVTLAPLLLHSPGGTSPGAGAAFDLTWQRSQFGLRLQGAGLVMPNTLIRWIGLEGVVFAKSFQSRMTLSSGAGVNLLSVYLRGTTELELRVHDDTILTVAPCLDVRSYYSLGDALALGVGVLGMIPLRSDVIRVDDREVGRYGRLILTLGLGLQAAMR
jgi:hypothetical protein